MTTLVVGMSGWWSGIFPFLRKPITLVFDALDDEPGLVFIQKTWRGQKEILEFIQRDPTIYRKIILLGHSYGADACTHLAAGLAISSIEVDLFVSLDKGMDSFVIIDKAIMNNVKRVDEYHVIYQRLMFVPGWKGVHNYYDVESEPGAHTSTFTNPKMVKRVADSIREEHRRSL